MNIVRYQRYPQSDLSVALGQFTEQVGLAAIFEHAFEFVADVEMIFNGLLAAAGDDDDLVAAGCHRFFDAVLDDRLVDEREHFLGLGFGGGQEARAEAGGGENGFANFHGHKGSRSLSEIILSFVRQRGSKSTSVFLQESWPSKQITPLRLD